MPVWFLGALGGWEPCPGQVRVCFGHCVFKGGSMAVSRSLLTPRGCKPSPVPPQKMLPTSSWNSQWVRTFSGAEWARRCSQGRQPSGATVGKSWGHGDGSSLGWPLGWPGWAGGKAGPACTPACALPAPCASPLPAHAKEPFVLLGFPPPFNS